MLGERINLLCGKGSPGGHADENVDIRLSVQPRHRSAPKVLRVNSNAGKDRPEPLGLDLIEDKPIRVIGDYSDLRFLNP